MFAQLTLRGRAVVCVHDGKPIILTYNQDVPLDPTTTLHIVTTPAAGTVATYVVDGQSLYSVTLPREGVIVMLPSCPALIRDTDGEVAVKVACDAEEALRDLCGKQPVPVTITVRIVEKNIHHAHNSSRDRLRHFTDGQWAIDRQRGGMHAVNATFIIRLTHERGYLAAIRILAQPDYNKLALMRTLSALR